MSINSTEKIALDIGKVDYDKDLPNEEQACKNARLHKRLDDMMEEKRLKSLLDNEEDWEID
mgnify:CR=1 FL=1